MLAAKLPNLSLSSRRFRFRSPVDMLPEKCFCSSMAKLMSALPAEVFNWLWVRMVFKPVPLTTPFMWISPNLTSSSGTLAFSPFMFSEMKLMVCADKLRSLMSAVHTGFVCDSCCRHPLMFILISPVFEPTFSVVTFSSSPLPLKAAWSDSVLLKFFSAGTRQSRSDNVMTDGLMLPVYLSDGVTK